MSRHCSICKSPAADYVQQRAAADLGDYLKRIFAAKVSVDAGQVADADFRFVIGLVDDAHVQRACPSLPALSSQGHLVRKVDDTTMLLAGGSGSAVGWAVYELAQRLGVRYLLHGDVLPLPGPALVLPQVDQVFEPRLSLRSWRQMSELGYGPIMWTLDEHKRVLGQLFKLKYNSVHFSSWPHFPMIDLEVAGVCQTTAEGLFGEHFAIDQTNIGREHLPPGMTVLTPPALVGATSYDQKRDAWRSFWHAVLDEADRLGMHSSMAIQPLEFPVEFRPLLAKPTEESIQAGALTCSERGDLTHPGHMELVRANVAAHLDQWHRVDELILGIPEHPHAEANFSRCWNELDKQYGLEPQYRCDQLLAAAQSDHLVAGGVERADRDFKSIVCMVHFFTRLIDQTDLAVQAAAANVKIGINIKHILPFLHKVLWPGATLQVFLDYTSSRSVRRLTQLADIDTAKMPSKLILTFQDDNVGWYPQVSTHGIHTLVGAMERYGYTGYDTRYWSIGDLDPSAAHLSRASWDSAASPRSVYQDHLSHAYSPEDVPSLCDALRLQEDVTLLQDLDMKWTLFPLLNFGNHYIESEDPVTAGFYHIRANYDQARKLVQQRRAVDGSPQRSRRLDYWIARLSFAVEALNSIERQVAGGCAVAAARKARADNDAATVESQLQQARRCYAAAVNYGQAAVRAAAGAVRDDSDRGAIAVYHQNLVRNVKQHSKLYLASIEQA